MNAPALEERIHVHNVKKKSKETRRKQAEASSEPQGLAKWLELDQRARNRPGYCGGEKL